MTATSTARQQGPSTTAPQDGSSTAFMAASEAYFEALDSAIDAEEEAEFQRLWWSGAYGRRGLHPVRGWLIGVWKMEFSQTSLTVGLLPLRARWVIFARLFSKRKSDGQC